MMQPQMPLGPPMGGGMGPPMGQPAPMPMGPMAGPMPGSQQVQVQGQQGVVGYGGSARGRAGFRDYMQRRKAESQGGMGYQGYDGGTMGYIPALAPPPVPHLLMPQNAMIGRQVSVGGFGGSAPVQVGSQPMMGQRPVGMMGGGVIPLREPLFGGLGRY
jgi:hypothetical protein